MNAPLGNYGNRIFPALVTPLLPGGGLDVPSAERLIDHLYTAGVGGLYVLGTTGEGVYLDAALRRQLAEVAVAASRGRGHVVVHVGATQGSLAYELTAHAGRIGADAVASIPPSFGGYSWPEVRAYYHQLTEASRLPVLAYYIPMLTGTRLTLDELTLLAEMPGVAGLKFTDFNLYLMQRLMARMRADQVVFHGADEVLAFGLSFGAQGGIGTTYNFMPQLVLEIFGHVAAGRLADAVAAQKRANEAIEVLLTCQTLAATKQILVWQGLIDHAECAPPRAQLTSAEQSELRRRLMQTHLGPTLVR